MAFAPLHGAIMNTTAARLSALYLILFGLRVAARLLHDVAVGAHADGADAGDDQRGSAAASAAPTSAAACRCWCA
jgi:hypothetical protein